MRLNLFFSTRKQNDQNNLKEEEKKDKRAFYSKRQKAQRDIRSQPILV